MKTEQDLRTAVDNAADQHSLQSAIGGLALFLSMAERYYEAEPFWDQAVELLTETTSLDHREVGTFIFNKVEYHSLPAGLVAQSASVAILRMSRIDPARVRQRSPRAFGIRRATRLATGEP